MKLASIKTFTRLFAVLGVMAFAVPMSGCNTVQGAGEDLESVGEAGEEAIND